MQELLLLLEIWLLKIKLGSFSMNVKKLNNLQVPLLN